MSQPTIPSLISTTTDIEQLKAWAYQKGLPQGLGYDDMRPMYYIRIIKGFQPIPKGKKHLLLKKIAKENDIRLKDIKKLPKDVLLNQNKIGEKVEKIKKTTLKRKQLIERAVTLGFDGNKKKVTSEVLQKFVEENKGKTPIIIQKKNKRTATRRELIAKALALGLIANDKRKLKIDFLLNFIDEKTKKPTFQLRKQTDKVSIYTFELNEDINTENNNFVKEVKDFLETLRLEPSQWFQVVAEGNFKHYGFRTHQWQNFDKFVEEFEKKKEAWRYEIFCQTVEIIVLKPEQGACNTDNEKIIKLGNGVKFISPKSSNNNCFFYCLKEELQSLDTTLTKSWCNSIRKSVLGKNENCAISKDDAVKIIKHLNLVGKVDIMSSENELTPADKNLFIIYNNDETTQNCDAGHWVIFKGKAQKCSRCGEIFATKHSDKRCKSRQDYLKKHSEYHGKQRTVPKGITLEEFDNSTSVLHWDIETSTKIQGFENQHVPFCLGYEYFDANISDWVYNTIVGDGCIEKFLKSLPSLPENVKFINAYNGSNFDNRFLLGEALKFADREKDVPKPRFLINNGSLIKCTISFAVTKCEETKKSVRAFELIDLCKHTQCSLRDLLNDLKCDVLKGEIDYNKFDAWDRMSPEFQNDILTYLRSDVIGLRKAFCLMNADNFQKTTLNLSNFLSTSHLAYDCWKEKMRDVDYDIVLMNKAESDFCRQAVYGGRTHPNKKHFMSQQYEKILAGEISSIDQIDDYCVDLDVVSLYPTAMHQNKYPVGKHYHTDYEQKGFFGVYECEVVCPKNILTAQIPRKENGLIWDLEDRKQVLTSVDIDRARSYGYEITCGKGIYWRKSEYIFKDYIDEWFEVKAHAKKGSPARALAKLMLNSLYGKMIQKPIIEKTELVKTRSEMYSILNNNIVTNITEVNGTDYLYFTFHSKFEKVLDETVTKPGHIGAFILAYSRNIMSEYIRKLNPEESMDKLFYYTDTDSLQTHCSTVKNIEKDFGKQLGQLDNDLGDNAKIVRGIWVAPKLYRLEYAKNISQADITSYKNMSDKESVNAIYRGQLIKITNKTELTVGDLIILFHVRGKGVSSSQFNDNLGWYEDMLDGKAITAEANNNFKKLNFSLTSKQRKDGQEQFATICLQGTKTLNKSNWWGRRFVSENISYPHGYSL